MDQGIPYRRPPAGKAVRWLWWGAVIVLLAMASAVLPADHAVYAAPPDDVLVRSITPAFPEGEPSPPAISAKAAILIDAGTGRVLFSHAANVRLPMASTTKIMTAILALETMELDREITVSRHAASTAGSRFGLVPGEKLTVEQLVYGLMVLSGNDIAMALAEASAGSLAAFVSRMNQKADELGLTNTRFVNACGLHAQGHYSSAKDLAALAVYAMQNAVFRRIVNTAFYAALRPGPDGRTFLRVIENHNLLLREYPWVTGVKTGSTPYAKYCLVFSGRRDGLSLIGVILGAQDEDTRWSEAKAVLDFGYEASPRTILAERGRTVLSLEAGDHLGRELRLVSGGVLVKRVFKEDEVLATAKLSRAPTLPVWAGEVFGTLEFTTNGNLLGSVPLLAAEPVKETTFTMIMRAWQDMWPPGVPLASRL